MPLVVISIAVNTRITKRTTTPPTATRVWRATQVRRVVDVDVDHHDATATTKTTTTATCRTITVTATAPPHAKDHDDVQDHNVARIAVDDNHNHNDDVRQLATVMTSASCVTRRHWTKVNIERCERPSAPEDDWYCALCESAPLFDAETPSATQGDSGSPVMLSTMPSKRERTTTTTTMTRRPCRWRHRRALGSTDCTIGSALSVECGTSAVVWD